MEEARPAGVPTAAQLNADPRLDLQMVQLEAFEEGLKEFTSQKKNTADVFELRYGSFLQDDGSSWQLGEEVLDKDEAMKVLSAGW